MARIVLLDAGIVGLCCANPSSPGILECQAWVTGLLAAGVEVVVAEVTYYEVKRGLLWNNAIAKLGRFEGLLDDLNVIPITFMAWDKAAEFWALLHRTGLPTAGAQALDGDAILAAVAATIAGPGDSATIATTNVRHLARFPGVDARLWTQIT